MLGLRALELQSALRDIDPALGAAEDIRKAGDQCYDLRRKVANPDETAACRFSTAQHKVAVANGKRINSLLRDGYCSLGAPRRFASASADSTASEGPFPIRRETQGRGIGRPLDPASLRPEERDAVAGHPVVEEQFGDAVHCLHHAGTPTDRVVRHLAGGGHWMVGLCLWLMELAVHTARPSGCRGMWTV
ncbi:hypothetical protein [Streptomyces sp. PSAA01]|uniref:hypothetical protein n=1 Tax=Streptomyces sp. PSAA01 TaxID=2912762 RepID=UPI001F1CCB78|nr:hypothetical protein [Streptomyces sp. PSAA01]MCG0284965.1 hypothetical protein [Streptomyces sp. PSAA01]